MRLRSTCKDYVRRLKIEDFNKPMLLVSYAPQGIIKGAYKNQKEPSYPLLFLTKEYYKRRILLFKIEDLVAYAFKILAGF